MGNFTVSPEAASIPVDRYKRSSQLTFDSWGSKYDRNLVVRLFAGSWDRQVLRLAEMLGSDARVLDVGCATGRLLGKLAGRGFAGLAGCDISTNALGAARDLLDRIDANADLQLIDAEAGLPWDRGEFGLVTMVAVLHHFPNPILVMEEAARVLKKGGVLIVVDPLLPFAIRQLVNTVLKARPLVGDYRYYSALEAKRLVGRAGLSVANLKRVQWHSFSLECTKH